MIVLRIITSLIILFWGVIFIIGGIMDYKKPWYPTIFGIIEIIQGTILCIWTLIIWFWLI